MSRAPANFQEVFDALARALNHTPAEVAANADLRAGLLEVMNRAYKRGYGKRSWEDAWDGQSVTPVNGVIDYSVIADARRFEIWSSDPRVKDSRAYEKRFTTALDGVHLESGESTAVWVMSLPKEPKFTTTAYAGGTTYAAKALVLYTDGQVYQSLQASNTGNNPATATAWWKLQPMLEVLAEFTVAFARGTYLMESGQAQTGGEARKDALVDLDELAQAEYFRCATNVWRPKQ